MGCMSDFKRAIEALFITLYHILCAPLELTQLIGSLSIQKAADNGPYWIALLFSFFPFFLSKIQFSALYRTVSEQLTADNTGLMVNARRVSAPKDSKCPA